MSPQKDTRTLHGALGYSFVIQVRGKVGLKCVNLLQCSSITQTLIDGAD